MARKALSCWFFVVVLSFFALPVFAADLKATGRVVADGKALAGAEVALWPLLGRYEQARRQLAGLPSEPATRMRTGEDGRFELLAPAPGMWRARVEAAGWEPVEIELTPLLETVELPPAELEKSTGSVAKPSDSRRRPPIGGWVWLTPPSPPPAPDPTAGAPRRVRIVDNKGQPLAGVIVFRAGETRSLAQTDPAGEAVLPPSKERVTLELLTSTGAAVLLPLEPAKTEKVMPEKIEFLPAPVLTGKVIGRTSRQPLAGAWVWRPQQAGDFSRTDAAGSYSLPGRAEPPTMLSAAAQDHVPLLERTSAAGSLPTLALVPAGSIAGRVVDGERRPVADVEITLTLEADGGAPGMARFQPGGWVTTRTSARGEFHAPGVAAGERYRLEWRKAGFAPGKKALEPLEASEKRAGIELVLEPGHKALGRVTDTADQPIAGASIRLLPVPEEARDRFRRRGARDAEGATDSLTDGEGRFEAAGLSAGRWDLAVEAEGFAPVTVPGVVIAAETAVVDLGTVILAAGATLEGRVRNPSGQLIEGAEIRTFETGGMPFIPAMAIVQSNDAPARARSDAEGRFRVGGLAPGVAVSLVVSRDGFIATALPGIEPPSSSVEVVLQPASRISGRVLDPERRPVVEAAVMSRAAEGGLAGSSMPVVARSDAEGNFEIEGVQPGRVEVSVRAQGFQDFTLAGLEVPTDKTVEGLELVLTRGAVVEGTVVDDAGNPLVGVAIQVLDPREGEFSRRSPRAQTDGDGRYSIANAVPGPRSVEAKLEGYDRAVRDVEIKPGVNRVDLVLGSGVEVAGRVVDGAGAGLAGATVKLGSTQGFRFSASAPETTSAADGGFRFTGVPAGDYALSAEKTGYAATRAEQPLEVRAQPMSGLELVLTTGATVHGAIRGLPFEELGRLRVLGVGKGGVIVGQVDYEGRYEVAPVGGGEWVITAQIEGGGRTVAESVIIEPGVAEVERDLVFKEGFTLSGVAVRQGGEVIAGAPLLVHGKIDGPPTHTATRHDGTFRIEGLENGVYTVTLLAFGTGLTYSQDVEVEGDTEVQLEIRVGRVRGRVLEGEGGRGLQGARVRLAAVDQEVAFPGLGVESDGAGNFDLGEVMAGRWRVLAEKAGYATAAVAIEVEDVVDSLELRLVPSEGVWFSVAWAAGGIPSAVQVLVAGGEGLLLNGSYTTGEDGRVWLTQVPPGAWRLLIQTGESAVTALQVQAPGDAGRIVLEPGGRLDLRVGELAENAAEAKLTLVGLDGQVFTPLDWMATGKSEIPLFAGKASVSNLGLGNWTAVVTAADGRRWSGQVSIVPGVITTLELR